ncbi:MAG: response regulator, partial [bacterium]
VEDNEMNRKIVIMMLKSHDMTCDVAIDGREAYLSLRKNDYDIVFMDCQMPVMDGYESTSKIREEEGNNKHTTIIAMTANAMEGDRAKCIEAGMDDYISKPINFDTMFKLIDANTKPSEKSSEHFDLIDDNIKRCTSETGLKEEDVKELRKEAKREGMEGISPRYIQDKISNALVSEAYGDMGCVNPFMVMNELESGLKHHSLIDSDDKKKHYMELLAIVKQEYEDIVKNEVQRAISADDDAIARLCSNYIDNVKAYTRKEKVKNKYTGENEEPDERLMRSIEEKIEIPESRKDDFRKEIMNYIAALSIEGKQFDYTTNERLYKALELKLFEDQKDTIKLTSLVTRVIDKETQEKIDIVKSRLIKNYGYCEICSTDVLNFVASIFARGDVRREN